MNKQIKTIDQGTGTVTIAQYFNGYISQKVAFLDENKVVRLYRNGDWSGGYAIVDKMEYPLTNFMEAPINEKGVVQLDQAAQAAL